MTEPTPSQTACPRCRGTRKITVNVQRNGKFSKKKERCPACVPENPYR